MEEQVKREDVKKRLRQVIIKYAVILGIGFAYFLFVMIKHVGLSCPIHTVTGKYCPGCGISRMCLAILRLDFRAAYLSNRFLFILAPFLIVYIIVKEIGYIRNGNRVSGRVETAILWGVLAVTIAFGVMRNMEAFAYLRPM